MQTTTTISSPHLQKRLRKELDDIAKQQAPEFYIASMPSALEWQCVLHGPVHSPYEHGHFHVRVVFPQQYPFSMLLELFFNFFRTTTCKIYYSHLSSQH